MNFCFGFNGYNVQLEFYTLNSRLELFGAELFLCRAPSNSASTS